MTEDLYLDAVEHLNRVVALTLPPLLTTTASAALFLLRSHREFGTQIRQSVYDCAVELEKINDHHCKNRG